MHSVGISDNHIDGMFIVELVQLEPAADHRNVPLQQIDEDLLTGLEHGFEDMVFERSRNGASDDDHRSFLLLALAGGAMIAEVGRSAIFPEMGIMAE